ncbi:hypothetical protein EII32_08790 [Prevotella sp. OH937_COT-195]|nr:hypothetical protein EII32_08790 [Prevotella sp. OH937_COT-195]
MILPNLNVYAQQMTEGDTHSPYILAVDEYCPAPGQFVNEIPEYAPGDDAATMVQKCTELIAGKDFERMITLGAWGGYVTFHFDHSIANIPGKRDFLVHGNAFKSKQFNIMGGSSESGIIMVSKDINRNGLPDDPWYEISGSCDTDSADKVVFDYSVTYTRADMQDIPWTDNKGGSGSVLRNKYHKQEYYPLWVTDNSLTFEGIRLPDNAVLMKRIIPNFGEIEEWCLMFFRYGYTDNQPVDLVPQDGDDRDNIDACSIDIAWAVDKNRQSVSLDFIDFVRVYSGLNQTVKLLGETSTEVSGAEDLHLEESLAAIIAAGIDDVNDAYEVTEVARHTADGVRITTPRRGLNIVKMSNGEVRKILIP